MKLWKDVARVLLQLELVNEALFETDSLQQPAERTQEAKGFADRLAELDTHIYKFRTHGLQATHLSAT